MRVLYTAPDVPPLVEDVTPDLPGIRSLLAGGMLEVIQGRCAEGAWSAYLDEEGKLKGLPANEFADGFARRLGWRGARWDVLAGPVIFFGPPDAEGDETAVPEWLVKLAEDWAR